MIWAWRLELWMSEKVWDNAHDGVLWYVSLHSGSGSAYLPRLRIVVGILLDWARERLHIQQLSMHSRIWDRTMIED